MADSAHRVPVVAVSGAAGQISYSLVFRLIAGDLFGPDCPLVLRLLETEAARPQLEGVAMELADCASPLLASVSCHDQPDEAFRDADVVFLIGARPRTQGMERADLLSINAAIFSAQGGALDRVAHPKVRVLVVGNPVNTNALIALRNAPRLSPQNFTGMTRLDHNRAVGLVAQKAGLGVTDVHQLAIWGNHSTSQFPDLHQTRLGGAPAFERIDQAWYETVMIPTVRQRGAEVIRVRGRSSAGSAAEAALSQMRDWLFGTPGDSWTSMAVSSRGEYGIAEGLFFSFPIRVIEGHWQIVEGLPLNALQQRYIRHSEAELLAERALVGHLI